MAAAAPSERANFELYFPPRDRAGLQALIEAQNRPDSPIYHQFLTPQQFARSFGPTAATLAQVTAELAARGLRVTEHRGQMLQVAGTAAAVESLFGVRLFHGRFADGSQRLVADRALTMPRAIAASGALTPEFSRAASPHVDSQDARRPLNIFSTVGPYYAFDLRQAYDFPSAASITAAGVNIAILMAGNYTNSDVFQYFLQDGLSGADTPQLSSVPINGGLAFSTTNSRETELDIEQSGGVSIGANVRLYDLSDLGFATVIFGLQHIVEDNFADVVNMSFGADEAVFTAAENGGISQGYILSLYDILFSQGVAQGITFVASSGDHGAIPLVGNTPTLTVESPADDPFVVAVGGTNLVTTHIAAGNYDSVYVSENANHDTEPNGEVWGSGGGISIWWGKPSYQTLVPTPSTNARTVPDVAMHMGGCPGDAITCSSPDSSDAEFFGGKTVFTIGTSAAAPDFAGLLALKKKLTGKRLGWENVDIYTRAKKQIEGVGIPFHHAGIPGNNGHYSTAVPYDLVIGNGTVNGRQLLDTALPPSGVPHTSTNP
jgi:subtilase family serine protease